MRAVKLNGEIPADHVLRLSVPGDVPEGPAEVILLVPDRRSQAPSRSLRQFLLENARSPMRERTKEEIDRYLEEERASWD